MEQETDLKLEKECDKAIESHGLFKFYAEYVLCNALDFTGFGWMKHKLESRLLGEITTASDMQMIPL